MVETGDGDSAIDDRWRKRRGCSEVKVVTVVPTNVEADVDDGSARQAGRQPCRCCVGERTEA